MLGSGAMQIIKIYIGKKILVSSISKWVSLVFVPRFACWFLVLEVKYSFTTPRIVVFLPTGLAMIGGPPN